MHRKLVMTFSLQNDQSYWLVNDLRIRVSRSIGGKC